MSFAINDSHSGTLSLVAAQHEDWIIQQAIALLEQRVFNTGPQLPDSTAVGDYLRLKLTGEPNEVFAVVFLNCHNAALAYEPLFKGSITQTTVYPRVIVQRALALNASGVIFAHQHPSGVTHPSIADRVLTDRLKQALDLVDVRVVDHLIVGKGRPFSFAESGLL